MRIETLIEVLQPPRLYCEPPRASLHGSIVSLHSSQLFILMRIWILLSFCFVVHLDPAFHFDADPIVLWNRNRNFLLSGTGTGCISVPISDRIWIRIQYKMEYRIQKSKIKNVRPNFWETMLLLTLKRQVFLC
jgi:hypothetical protein